MSLLHDYMKVAMSYSSKVSEEELKKICNQIQQEEEVRFKNPHLVPKGDNIFLAIERETDEDSESVEYITIEKDSRGYFCGYWTGRRSAGERLVRTKFWPLLETTAHKTVLYFVRIYKFLNEFIRDENTVF